MPNPYAMPSPPWTFEEFPMAIAMLNGKPSRDPYYPKDWPVAALRGKSLPVVEVTSIEEFEALMGGAEVVESERRLKSDEDDKAAAIEAATVANVPFDRRWSAKRILEAVDSSKGSDPVM